MKTFKILKKSSKWEFFFNKFATKLLTWFKYPDFACNFVKKDLSLCWLPRNFPKFLKQPFLRDLLMTGFFWQIMPLLPLSVMNLPIFPNPLSLLQQENFVMLFVSYSRNKFIASSILFNVCHSRSTTFCWQSSSRKQKIYVGISKQKKHDSTIW